MADPARRSRSFEELYAEIERLPEGMTGEILEEDVVRVMSRPGKRHRRAGRGCLEALAGADANVGGTGWWIELETEIRVPSGKLVVPDQIRGLVPRAASRSRFRRSCATPSRAIVTV